MNFEEVGGVPNRTEFPVTKDEGQEKEYRDLFKSILPAELQKVPLYDAFVSGLIDALISCQEPIIAGSTEVVRDYHGISHPLGMLKQFSENVSVKQLSPTFIVAQVIDIVFHDKYMEGDEVTRRTPPKLAKLHFKVFNEMACSELSLQFISNHSEFLELAGLDIQHLSQMAEEGNLSTIVDRSNFYQKAVYIIQNIFEEAMSSETVLTDEQITNLLERALTAANIATLDLCTPLKSHPESIKAARGVLFEEFLKQLMMLVPFLAHIASHSYGFAKAIEEVIKSINSRPKGGLELFATWLKERLGDDAVFVNDTWAEWVNTLLYTDQIHVIEVILNKIKGFNAFQPSLANNLVGNYSAIKKPTQELINGIKLKYPDFEIQKYQTVLDQTFKPFQETLDNPLQYILASGIINTLINKKITSGNTIEEKLRSTIVSDQDLEKLNNFAVKLAIKIEEYLSSYASDTFKGYPVSDLVLIQQMVQQFDNETKTISQTLIEIVLKDLDITTLDDIENFDIDHVMINFSDVFATECPTELIKLIRINDISCAVDSLVEPLFRLYKNEGLKKKLKIVIDLKRFKLLTILHDKIRNCGQDKASLLNFNPSQILSDIDSKTEVEEAVKQSLTTHLYNSLKRLNSSQSHSSVR